MVQRFSSCIRNDPSDGMIMTRWTVGLVPGFLFFSSGLESFQCSSYLDFKARLLLASGLYNVNVMTAIGRTVLIAEHEAMFCKGN